MPSRFLALAQVNVASAGAWPHTAAIRTVSRPACALTPRALLSPAAGARPRSVRSRFTATKSEVLERCYRNAAGLQPRHTRDRIFVLCRVCDWRAGRGRAGLRGVELLGFGGAGQRDGLRVRGRRRGHPIEGAGADLALVAGGGVAGRLGGELGLLEPDIGGHALRGEALGQVEHRVVEGVEAGQGDELEPVAHRGEFLAELRDGLLVQM